jgi:hypothetical protein
MEVNGIILPMERETLYLIFRDLRMGAPKMRITLVESALLIPP